MNDTIALNYSILNENVKVNKRKVIKELEKKSESARLELIKEAFKNNNLSFDDNINDYQEFIKSVKGNLKDRDLSLANNIIDNVNKEIDKLINELKSGSTTAFTKFLNGVNKIVTPVGNMVVDSLALRTLLTLTPTAIGKAGVGIVLTGINLYNLHKIDKYKRVTNKTFELNRILQELEITKDKNGNFIDTRFNDTIQKAIVDFLNTNGILFENTGYLSIRDTIYNLNDDKKEELCKIISNLKGSNVDFDKRLSDFNDGLFKRFGKKYLKDMSIGATTGIGLATTVNSVAPTAIPALVNGTFIGKIVEKLSSSPILGWFSGALSGVGTFLGNYFPTLGKIFSMENLAIFAIGGAGIGLLSAIGKKICSIIKNRKDRFNAMSDAKKLQELDNKLYSETDREEIIALTEKLSKESVDREKVIINLVCEYMDELGINYNRRPTNKKELNDIVNSLSNKDKNKIYDLMTSLEDYAKREPNKFKRGIKKIGNFLKAAVSLGLASLSVIDLLSAGAFLSGLKSKIFKNEGLNVPDRIREFDDSIGRSAYEEKQRAIEEAKKVSTPVKEEHVPMPSSHGKMPSATPGPQATPGPDAVVNSSSISKTTQGVDILPKKNGRIDVNKIVSEYSNRGQVTTEFSNLTDSNLYYTLENILDPRMAERALTVLTPEDLERLQLYMETSADINRNSLGYNFLKDAITNNIANKNSEIDKILLEIEKKMAFDNNVESIVKKATIPLTAVTSYEKAKKR